MLTETPFVKAFKFLSALIDWTPGCENLYFEAGGNKIAGPETQCNTWITSVLGSVVMGLLETPYAEDRLSPRH
jgi:hypothetical protein